MIGKPYSGKLNVRFDEGELEIEPMLLRQLSTLPKDFHPRILKDRGISVNFQLRPCPSSKYLCFFL